MDWMIGATDASSDNVGTPSHLILTLTSVTNSISQTGSQASAGFLPFQNQSPELTTTMLTHGPVGVGTATTTTANVYPLDARGDAVNAEGANEGTTTATVARISTNRSQWTFTAG